MTFAVPDDDGGPKGGWSFGVSWRALAIWLVIVGIAVALDGLVGGLTMVAVAAVLLARLPVRLLGFAGVALLAAVPVAIFVRGVPSSDNVSPLFVYGSLVPHHLMFSGLLLVCSFAVIDLLPHMESWVANAPNADADLDKPPLGLIAGIAVLVVVAVGAVLASLAVLRA